MNILAIDSSSSVLSIAFKKGKFPLTEKNIEGTFYHLENLLPVIDQMLKKNKLRPEDIDTFLIGRGPGSFTGLRIGFGTLKGFLAAQKRDCYGALSLDMIPENLDLPEKSRLAVCLDARREKIFTRFYKRSKSQWVPASKPLVLSLDELLEKLEPGDYAAGDALERYQERIQTAFQKGPLNFLDKKLWFPKSSTMILWHSAGEHLLKGKSRLRKLTQNTDFLPGYFRLSEPEEKRQAHAKHR